MYGQSCLGARAHLWRVDPGASDVVRLLVDDHLATVEGLEEVPGCAEASRAGTDHAYAGTGGEQSHVGQRVKHTVFLVCTK